MTAMTPPTAVEWVGGQPIGETIIRRVNRTTARTLIDVDVASLPSAAARDVEVWVENQMFSMPIHIKAGIAAVALWVTAHSLLRTGRPPWRLPAGARQRLLQTWAASRIPPVAQYVRLERSLVLYGAHEHPAGFDALAG